MIESTFGELIEAASASLVRGDSQLNITNVEYDSRKIKPGSLFVALRGGYVDGHDFLGDALSRGAVATLVEDASGTEGFRAVAVAANTRAALSPLATEFFGQPAKGLGIIGVTGTDGKTTTAYLIDAMLRANGYRTGLIGTISVRVGDNVLEHDTRQTTPESLEVHRLLRQMSDEHVDWVVLEATSHALALYRLDDVPFDIGVITNVTREHLDFHGSVEAYRVAKARLLRRVEIEDDRGYPRAAVVNFDDEGSRELGDSSQLEPLWFSSSDENARLFARDIDVHAGGTRFTIQTASGSAAVNLKLIGGYNVFNAMAAAGVGQAIGLGLDEITAGLESLPHVPGRMQPVIAGQPFNVIVDYAHSPASLEETLRLVRTVTSGQVIIVTGSAGERDRGKRPLQGRISVDLADLVIFTSEDPRFEDPDQIIREISKGAESVGARKGTHFLEIENRKEAIETAIARAKPGDSVLLAGKGHETSMIYRDEQVSWDEAREARRALERHGFTDMPESEGKA